MGLTWGSLGAHSVSLGSHWGLTGVSLAQWGLAGDTQSFSRLPERAPEKGPQNAAFLHPACKAKLRSCLDGSTVSTVSPEPLLGTILASIWGAFGYHSSKMLHIDCDVTGVTQMSHYRNTNVTHLLSHYCHIYCHTTVTLLLAITKIALLVIKIAMLAG